MSVTIFSHPIFMPQKKKKKTQTDKGLKLRKHYGAVLFLSPINLGNKGKKW